MASVGIVKITNSETIRKWHALFRIQEQFPILRKEKYQLPYLLQANYNMSEAIKKYGCKNMDTLGRKWCNFTSMIHLSLKCWKKLGFCTDLFQMTITSTGMRRRILFSTYIRL